MSSTWWDYVPEKEKRSIDEEIEQRKREERYQEILEESKKRSETPKPSLVPSVQPSVQPSGGFDKFILLGLLGAGGIAIAYYYLKFKTAGVREYTK